MELPVSRGLVDVQHPMDEVLSTVPAHRWAAGARDTKPHRIGELRLLEERGAGVISDNNADAPYRSTQQEVPVRSKNNLGDAYAWRYLRRLRKWSQSAATPTHTQWPREFFGGSLETINDTLVQDSIFCELNC